MSVLRDIKVQTDFYAGAGFSVESANVAPTVESLARGRLAQVVETAFLVAELRVPAPPLDVRKLDPVLRLHRAFVAAVARLARAYSGHIQHIGDDRVIVAFEPTPGDIKLVANNAATVALHLVYAFNTVLRPTFKHLGSFDIAVGVERGEVLAIKGSVRGDPHSTTVVWFGHAPRVATRLAEEGGSPYNVYVSESIYVCLNKELRYTNYTGFDGRSQDLSMWESTSLVYQQTRRPAMKTRYQVKLR